MSLTLIHLWVWQCANASDHGLQNHISLGYSWFLKMYFFQPWFLMWHFDSSLHHVRFTNWGYGLLLFPHMFIHASSGVSCLYVFQSLDSFLSIIFALWISLLIVLISKPEHTSYEILMHSHYHSTPTLRHNYTLCLTSTLLAVTS